MTRHFIELRTLGDWQSRLGNPERHWKRGASAMELAVAWTVARGNPRGMPAEVAALLDSDGDLADSVVDFAIPELRTPLPGGNAASQTDLWALLRNSRDTVGLSVEGKAREPFDQTVEWWLRGSNGRPPSTGRLERLAFLTGRLSLDQTAVGNLRYQLLHRAVAALVEAEAWGARRAVMLVQRFARVPTAGASSWHDFHEFASRLGVVVRPGQLTRADVPGSVALYLGWVDCRLASDEEVLAAMLGEQVLRGTYHSNQFEALCSLARRESWCWRLSCTTCGGVHFRYALRELARGTHPESADWITHGRTRPNVLAARLGPNPGFPFPLQEQRSILTIASAAAVAAIASRENFPSWLGYLGIVLNFCRDAEGESRDLTRNWTPQLCALLPADSELRRRLTAKVDAGATLSLVDLEHIESELIWQR